MPGMNSKEVLPIEKGRNNPASTMVSTCESDQAALSASNEVHTMLQLQQTVGKRAVGRMSRSHPECDRVQDGRENGTRGFEQELISSASDAKSVANRSRFAEGNVHATTSL
jgi:hypothetical protein